MTAKTKLEDVYKYFVRQNSNGDHWPFTIEKHDLGYATVLAGFENRELAEEFLAFIQRQSQAPMQMPSREEFYQWLGTLVTMKKPPPAYDDVYDWLTQNMRPEVSTDV